MAFSAIVYASIASAGACIATNISRSIFACPLKLAMYASRSCKMSASIGISKANGKLCNLPCISLSCLARKKRVGCHSMSANYIYSTKILSVRRYVCDTHIKQNLKYTASAAPESTRTSVGFSTMISLAVVSTGLFSSLPPHGRLSCDALSPRVSALDK